MAWSVEGTYFETCSCDLMCPCNLSFDHGATYDYCRATLVFNIKRGRDRWHGRRRAQHRARSSTPRR